MRRLTLFSLVLLLPAGALAERHELGLMLGGLAGRDLGSGPRLSPGTALQANYGYRLAGGGVAALYGEVHLLANPQRTVDSGGPLATRDVATLYVTPGIRVKFAPGSPIAPYIAAGGGYALYEHSTLRGDGRPNDAPRTITRGALDFGGGVDVRLWRWLSLRGEVRDFFTGRPAYNLRLEGGQHNVVAGGGIVIQWGD
jgi:opacity protein-like surface antigen